MPYDSNVFINCPFDKQYQKYSQILIFILTFYELEVHMSKNRSSAHDRLSEICKLINNSKYTFHDLSRHKAFKKGEFARFNMPFELGVDFGCFKYRPSRKDKIIAILDSSHHNYDRHLSDMSGRDILCHDGDPQLLFEIIPNWLRKHTPYLYDSPGRLKGYYLEWYSDYKASLKRNGFDLRKISDVNIDIYQKLMSTWIPNWKLANGYTIPTP